MAIMADLFSRPVYTKSGVQADVLRRPSKPEQAASPKEPEKPTDSHEARVHALAEILGGLYGDEALSIFPSQDPVTKALKGLGAKPPKPAGMPSPLKQKRQEGEKWKGPSGRSFVMRNGRAVPAKGDAKDTATKLGSGKTRLSREDAHGAVSALIDQIKAGDMTPEARGRLGEHLEHLRVDQLRALADKHQLFCPPKLKAQLIAKLHEHLLPIEVAHGDDIVDQAQHADKLANPAFTEDDPTKTIASELHRSANPPQAKEPEADGEFTLDSPEPQKKETPQEWLDRYDKELAERNKPKEEKPAEKPESKPMESPLRNPWSAPLTIESGMKLLEALKTVEDKADQKYKFGAIRTTSKPVLQGMAAKLGVSGEGTRADIAEAIFDHLNGKSSAPKKAIEEKPKAPKDVAPEKKPKESADSKNSMATAPKTAEQHIAHIAKLHADAGKWKPGTENKEKHDFKADSVVSVDDIKRAIDDPSFQALPLTTLKDIARKVNVAPQGMPKAKVIDRIRWALLNKQGMKARVEN